MQSKSQMCNYGGQDSYPINSGKPRSSRKNWFHWTRSFSLAKVTASLLTNVRSLESLENRLLLPFSEEWVRARAL